jgi:RNA polymerase sigma-70 factor (ECF subfamily)
MAAMDGRYDLNGDRVDPAAMPGAHDPSPRSPAPVSPGSSVYASAGAAADVAWLVAAAQGGDEWAFRQLYRTLHPGLLLYLRGLVGDEAEDVASEAWAQIARDLGSFSGDGPAFRAWSATISRHRALDHLRRLRRRPLTAASGDEVLMSRVAPDDTEAAAIESASTGAAIDLIASLPPDQAEAVLLRVVVGLDVRTAAAILGKRPGAVRTAAHRGLRRLAAMLGDADASAAQGRAPIPGSDVGDE